MLGSISLDITYESANIPPSFLTFEPLHSGSGINEKAACHPRRGLTRNQTIDSFDRKAELNTNLRRVSMARIYA